MGAALSAARLNLTQPTHPARQEWGEPGALPALLQLRVDSNRL